MRAMILLPIATALLLSGCSDGPESHPQAATNRPAVSVQAVAVISRDRPDLYEATGSVHARSTAVLSSKVMAYVKQVTVQAGDRVREGQVLVQLESQELEAAVRRAEAAQAEVQAAVPEADHAAAGAKANLDLARSTFRRMQELASKKSISNQEFDEASARLQSAEAAYEVAQARRTQFDSKLVQAEQEIRSARVMRDYTRLASPFAGIVTARSVEPGSLASPGAPLLTIEKEGAYRLEASVDESKLPLVKTGQTVEVTIDALDRRFPARVSEIVPAVDPGSRAYTVRIDLTPMPNLRSGIFGRAYFTGSARKVSAVPVAALVSHGQLQSVFVMEDGIARMRLVTTGKRANDAVEVLSGLSDGEKVIAPVPAGLSDGARVEVRP